MSTYFEANAQRRAQWGRTRRGGHTDSGVVVVHTYEAPAGRTWQAGARYLTTRTTPGSYHWLSDALGGTGHLAPWSAETWHCRITNPWSVGLSMMTYAADWRRLTPTQRHNLVRGTALGAARYSAWRVSTGRDPVPARRITRAQALARVPGFIGHGETDPARRSDPGAGFPWGDFLDHYRALTASQEDDMTPEQAQQLNEVHGRVVRSSYLDAKVSHVLARQVASDAVQANLVRALANVSGGEPFDEARLLDGIRRTVADALAAGVDVNVQVGGKG